VALSRAPSRSPGANFISNGLRPLCRGQQSFSRPVRLQCWAGGSGLLISPRPPSSASVSVFTTGVPPARERVRARRILARCFCAGQASHRPVTSWAQPPCPWLALLSSSRHGPEALGPNGCNILEGISDPGGGGGLGGALAFFRAVGPPGPTKSGQGEISSTTRARKIVPGARPDQDPQGG